MKYLRKIPQNCTWEQYRRKFYLTFILSFDTKICFFYCKFQISLNIPYNMYSWCYTVCVICQPSTTCTLFCSLYLNNWSGCFSCLASLLCSMLIHFLQGADRESTLLFPCGGTVIQYYCEYYEYTDSQNKASNMFYI